MFTVAVVVLMIQRRRDPYLAVAQASVLGVVLYLLLIPNFTELRLELAFLPAVAVGLALSIESLLARAGHQEQAEGAL